MPTLKVNDINMYYEQSGKGPDLVFISGLSVDHSMWNVKMFSDHFRVLIFDNRGVGQTDVPDGPYSMQQFADDTISLCRALGINKAHFVGHSMGGHITQLIGIHYPQMSDKLVIACSEQEFSVISYLATKMQVDLRKYNVPRELLVENYFPVLFSFGFLEDTERLDKFLKNNLSYPHPQSDKGYIAQVEAIRHHNTKQFLHKIKNRALIIGCEDDLLTPLKNSEYLKDHIPGAELKVIKECGHAPFIEKPEEFFQIIRDYLLH